MRPRSLLLAGGAVAGAATTALALRRLGSVWDRNVDACDGDPERLPDGETVTIEAADGAVLHGRVCGPSDGPTVVLVHCWTGAMTNWGPVACRLVDAGHRVVLVDQRGHGGSERGTDPYLPETLAADLAAWFAALDLRDVVLAGHSMGGVAAMAFTALHPDVAAARVRRQVLVATLAAPPRSPVWPTLPPQVRYAAPFMGPAISRGDVGLLGLLGCFGHAPARSQMEATRRSFLATDRVTMTDALVMLTSFDLRPVLPEIGVPTVVVAGARDRLTYPPMNREVAALIPGAHLEMLDDVGHMLPWEAPEAVTAAIVAADDGASVTGAVSG